MTQRKIVNLNIKNQCKHKLSAHSYFQMLSSIKQQFVELLSDIGFVKEGIVAKDVERAARSGGDGI